MDEESEFAPRPRPTVLRRAGAMIRAIALLSWVLPATYAAFVVRHDASADHLILFRHAHDLVRAVTDDVPFLWFVQLGPRHFPDLPISIVAYAAALGDPSIWGIVFGLINLLLTFGCLLVLLRALHCPFDQAWLVACGFFVLLLSLFATNDFMLTQILATSHHNTLLGMVLLFYAMPLLAASSRKRRTTIVVGSIVLFGLVSHANKLFVIWGVVPYGLALALLIRLGKAPRAALVTAMLITAGSLVFAIALEPLFYALPFLHPTEGSLFHGVNHMSIADRATRLMDAFRRLGGAGLLGLLSITVLLGVLGQRLDRPTRPGDPTPSDFFAATFATTLVVVPLAAASSGLLWARYLMYPAALAVLWCAWSIGLVLRRIRDEPNQWLVLVGVLSIVVVLPTYMGKARATSEEPLESEVLRQKLEDLQEEGRIGDAGLGSYWIAHKDTFVGSGLFIGSLTVDGAPQVLANDAYRNWRWQAGCPTERQFTFVVTARHGEFRLSPKALRRRFGRPAEIVKVPETPLRIWLYPDGPTDAGWFHDELRRLIAGKGKPVPEPCQQD